MRKSNMLWLMLAGICSAVLFYTSQQVYDGRERLSVLNASIAQEEEAMRVLTVEWSYLNQPARLESLAKQHLKLVPMTGARFADVDRVAPLPEAEAISAAASTVPGRSAPVVKAADFLSATAPVPETPVADEVKSVARRFGDVIKSLGAN